MRQNKCNRWILADVYYSFYLFIYMCMSTFFFWPYIVIYYVSLYLYEYIIYKKKKMYIRVIYSLDILSSTVTVFNMTKKKPFSSLCVIYYCFLFGHSVSSDDRFGLSRKHLFTIKIIITTCNDGNILYRSLQLESTENNCSNFKTDLKTRRRSFRSPLVGSHNIILYLCFYLYFKFCQKMRQYMFH